MINDLIRIDKNVGKNVLDFSALGKDAPLIKSLIYFFCHSYQNNLFGHGTLDPAVLAKEFKFTTNYLRSRHDDPTQLKGYTSEEVKELYALQEEQPEMRVWDSILENALWILKTTKINYRYGGQVFDPQSDQKESKSKTYYSEVKSIQFLTELSVTFRKNEHGGKEKVLYHYALDPSFVENLTNYYFKADHRSISLLRKPALDDLYVYLKNLRASLKGQDATASFSLLCELAHIDIQDSKQRKKKLNKCLKRIAEDTDLKFIIRWEKDKPEVRYRYKPIIVWESEPAIDGKAERNNIFYQKLVHELIQIYRKKRVRKVYNTSSEQKFLDWCRNSTTDQDEKVLAFQNAYFDIWRQVIKSDEYSVRRFMEQLPMINTIADIYTIKYRYLD
ncbi:MAG: hypothetical protein WA958_05340 [Tunicatimonas sp.]